MPTNWVTIDSTVIMTGLHAKVILTLNNMGYLYIAFSVYKFFCIAICMMMCLRMSRATMVPSRTWGLFTAAFFVWLISLTFATLFTRDIVSFLMTQPPANVFISNMISATIPTLFMFAIVRIRRGLKTLTKNHD